MVFFSDSEKKTVKVLEASSDPGLSKIKVPGAKKVRVLKVTKQSNGQLLCEICSGVFEDVNGAVKHMPYCEQESVTQWVGNITKKIRLAHSFHKSWCYVQGVPSILQHIQP